jgi:hypothetical protein
MKSREISRDNWESVFSVSETVSVFIITARRDVHLKKRPATSILMTDNLTPPHRSLGSARWNSGDRTLLDK